MGESIWRNLRHSEHFMMFESKSVGVKASFDRLVVNPDAGFQLFNYKINFLFSREFLACCQPSMTPFFTNVIILWATWWMTLLSWIHPLTLLSTVWCQSSLGKHFWRHLAWWGYQKKLQLPDLLIIKHLFFAFLAIIKKEVIISCSKNFSLCTIFNAPN